ncbi:MAG: ABC transporter permease subunit [Chloroflexota bacterium]|nr:ABC transporter permease subunit [Chloroflexota bacterium]MDE2884616.1 ABC transporter permease subunit [Chloroflexota bacterium]
MTTGISRVLPARWRGPEAGTIVMFVVIVALGSYLIYPMVLLLVLSFDVSPEILASPREWGISNWIEAWDEPLVFESIRNSFLVWFLGAIFSFPIAIAIALILARTRIPFTYGMEYMFWVAFMFPGLATTIGWMMLMDPDVGLLNTFVERLPFIEEGPFNIFGLAGIVWANLMGNGIAYKVILLTPAFRNMDVALEEAARVSGASKVSALIRVTLPVMISPIILVFALQILRVFSGFETEQLLGARVGFYVFSTLIFRQTTSEIPPDYAEAIVLATITLVLIGFIFPLQRWITGRRHYTTITGRFRPGLIDLGAWKWPIFLTISIVIILLTALPFVIIVMGSFMTRVGFFNAVPAWTFDHWYNVLTDPLFFKATRTTLILAVTAGVGSPLLFSVIAYLIVRTRWRGRSILDSIIWISAAFPGIISSLGLLMLFLGTPGLSWLYGSIWALILVVIISGNTTGTNVFKGIMVQIGADMEEAGRVAGAGWFRTYFRIVIPVLMPTMVLIGALNFISAASTTASIVLLASRDTLTLSLLALERASAGINRVEEAGIITLIIMFLTLGLALVARQFGLRIGVRQDVQSKDGEPQRPRQATGGQAAASMR